MLCSQNRTTEVRNVLSYSKDPISMKSDDTREQILPGPAPFSQIPDSAGALASPKSSSQEMTLKVASDELWMEEALLCAQRALEAGEVPVGAVVVYDGRVVGRGWNRNLTDCDPTAHAEIMALREAGRNVGNHRLGSCELFATIEPCAMCAGALVHARLSRLVYGAEDPKAGAVHSILQVVNHPRLNHQMEIRGGVLAGRAAEVLQQFFRNRR
jgi:tRNA(adenine34) deaminase